MGNVTAFVDVKSNSLVVELPIKPDRFQFSGAKGEVVKMTTLAQAGYMKAGSKGRLSAVRIPCKIGDITGEILFSGEAKFFGHGKIFDIPMGNAITRISESVALADIIG